MKKLSKKLKLSKTTIATLNQKDLLNIKGGGTCTCETLDTCPIML